MTKAGCTLKAAVIILSRHSTDCFYQQHQALNVKHWTLNLKQYVLNPKESMNYEIAGGPRS